MAQYDISIAQHQANGTVGAPASYMLEGSHTKQDIQPASTRRSDGDARYLLIQSESFWGQNDWSAGYGLTYPADATSFEDGVADSLTPHLLRAGFEGEGTTGHPVEVDDGVSDRAFVAYGQDLYLSGIDLYKLPSGGTTWSMLSGPTVSEVYDSVAFRGAIYTATYGVYGLESWNVTTGAKSSVVSTQFATDARLCAYGSMLFWVTYDTTRSAWVLNRYDPENPTATTTTPLAIFPIGPWDGVRSLVVLGQDLYITFKRSLWRFTSANGNSGILQGPLDTWVPVGDTYAEEVSGVAVAYQGALYYSTGGNLRRYFPGGRPQNVWPLPGRRSLPRGSGIDLDLCSFAVVDDRLFIAARRGSEVSTTQTTYLLCWDGMGMHKIGDMSITLAAAARPGRPFIAADGAVPGSVILFHRTRGSSPTGYACRRFRTGLGTRYYRALSEWYTSVLDFGMLDIPKSLTEIGLAVKAQTDDYVDVSVSVDGGAFTSWLAAAAPSATFHEMLYYNPPVGEVVVGERFQFRLTFAVAGAAPRTHSPEVLALTAIPNPVNPVRRGFRFSIPVSDAVVDHQGNRVYQTAAAVETAVQALRANRDSQYPLNLAWVDGATYLVRINALQEERVVSTAGGEPHWLVTLDCQELT